MSFDRTEFGRKLRSYREQRQLTTSELATATGIADDRFTGLEAGELLPTGDEILIVADFFQCDYRFFVSNEKLAAFQQTETLYRKFGNEFTKSDRRSIQEFFFLCECEAFLLTELDRKIEPSASLQRGTTIKAKARKLPRPYAATLGTRQTKSPATYMPTSAGLASTSFAGASKTRIFPV